MKKPIAFICYSSKDRKLKERLVELLKILKESIEIWDDSRIATGADWNKEIIKNIGASDIAILLLTNNFLVSDYIEQEEIPRFLRRRESKNLVVFPVLVKDCLWKRVDYLAKMQVWTYRSKPLWRSGGADEQALTALGDHIADLVKNSSPAGRKKKAITKKSRVTPTTSRAAVRKSREQHSIIGTSSPKAKSDLIPPAMLQADATIPQCLDNQFVSDKVFDYMISYGLDYKDPRVASLRERETSAEFIRSLVYSSQVVINRAFLKNSEFLYQNYSKRGANLDAFASLIKQQAIMPYLYREKSFIDNFTLDVAKEGDRAAKLLLEKTGGHIPCVRLAVSDERNDAEIINLERKFGNYLLNLITLRNEQIPEMLQELFTSHEAPNPLEFRKHLMKLSEYARRHMLNNGPGLTRAQVYKDWFVGGKSDKEKAECTLSGRFRKPGRNNPFLFELKKLVDLRYNTNLPDLLGRYTFTPFGMPGRLALQDTDAKTEKEVKPGSLDSLVDETRKYFTEIQRTFMSEQQKKMYLPLLEELSVADVVEIRKLSAWHEFSEAQKDVLTYPLEIHNRLENFQVKFENFQTAMSRWFYKKYPMEKQKLRPTRYVNYVTTAFQAAGQLIVLGIDPRRDEARVKGRAALHQEAQLKNLRIKECTLLLRFNVIDADTGRLDENRSYSVELLRDDENFEGMKVIDLIRSFEDIRGDHVEYSDSSQLAEQAK